MVIKPYLLSEWIQSIDRIVIFCIQRCVANQITKRKLYSWETQACRTLSLELIFDLWGVGKTSIILRHNGREFTTEVTPTLGANFVHSTMWDQFTGAMMITSDYSMSQTSKRVELEIWDTAGSEKFACMVSEKKLIELIFDLYNPIHRWSLASHWSLISIRCQCISVDRVVHSLYSMCLIERPSMMYPSGMEVRWTIMEI